MVGHRWGAACLLGAPLELLAAPLTQTTQWRVRPHPLQAASVAAAPPGLSGAELPSKQGSGSLPSTPRAPAEEPTEVAYAPLQPAAGAASLAASSDQPDAEAAAVAGSDGEPAAGGEEAAEGPAALLAGAQPAEGGHPDSAALTWSEAAEWVAAQGPMQYFVDGELFNKRWMFFCPLVR